jgi:hypothetical protein
MVLWTTLQQYTQDRHKNDLWLTFHEDDQDVAHDGDGGDEDEDGENKRTHRVCYLPLRLQQQGAGGTHKKINSQTTRLHRIFL